MTAGDQQKANGHIEPKVRVLKLQDDVGFRTLPDQSVRRHFQHGFAFNILCIGETGIGKSTLMDSLFNFSFDLPTSTHDHPDVKIMSKSFELVENNVKLNVGIVETVGYGDQINKQKSCQAIIDYINAKFEGYLQEELQISRKLSTFRDGRIHVCLYFITPTGHGLKALDLVCMKQLDSKVNLIPVIAKSDIISKQDLVAFKRRVQSELTNSGVQIYQFPVDDPMSPQDTNRQYNSLMPFAVIGSRDLVRVSTKMVRARQYPWGVVQIENEAHCDFTRLRDAVLRYNLADLVESTHVKHYELYRRMRLIAMGFGDAGIGDSSTFERKWAEHRASLQKREDDMRQTFVEKVSATTSSSVLSGADQNHPNPDNLDETSDDYERDGGVEDEIDSSHPDCNSKHNNNNCENNEMENKLIENGTCSLDLLFKAGNDEESLLWDDYLDELRYPIDESHERNINSGSSISRLSKRLITDEIIIQQSPERKSLCEGCYIRGTVLQTCKKDRMKVKGKETELKDKEREMNLRFDSLHKEYLMHQKRLDEDKRVLEDKINELQRKRQLVQQYNTMTLGKSKRR
ncbi:septin-2-like [Tropilaelaps mercedesae]|uniref:Septin-2-like n=1 Tax=Tropilaelaps mercedesae TaxID=418985 RepID=A0A1V9XEB7_9ACAR|nr:septin-2-like [Tropilaelaps mercedesae]